METELAGIDLAWQSEKNGSGIAIGVLQESRLSVSRLETGIISMRAVQSILNDANLVGISVDAPLIIRNSTGQRECERLIGREYGARKASCHTSNLSLYPNAASVALSKSLEYQGYKHLDRSGKWQIECYPHPALIEIFSLQERLLYKKGNVSQKRRGQADLADLLQSLQSSTVLSLEIPAMYEQILDSERILTLRGRELKDNEDALDALVCLYVGALFQHQGSNLVFGDENDGYIFVPRVRKRTERRDLTSRDLI